MKNYPFWITDMIVKGSERINNKIIWGDKKNGSEEFYKYGDSILRSIPGWMEISFFNNMTNIKGFSLRDSLLAWIFAMTKEEYGFAYEIAVSGRENFKDAVFTGMIELCNQVFQDKIASFKKKKEERKKRF